MLGNKLESLLTEAVLSLVTTASRIEDRLKRMERHLQSQSEQVATLVASLADNFSKLDSAIQGVVAAQVAAKANPATPDPDPSLAASIVALGQVNEAVKADLTKLAPAIEALPQTNGGTVGAAAPGAMEG